VRTSQNRLNPFKTRKTIEEVLSVRELEILNELMASLGAK